MIMMIPSVEDREPINWPSAMASVRDLVEFEALEVPASFEKRHLTAPIVSFISIQNKLI